MAYRKNQIVQRLGLMLFSLVVITALAGPPAAVMGVPPESTIPVTTVADEFGANPGGCSLREAIQAANLGDEFGGCPTGDSHTIIELPAGTYELGIEGAGEDLNESGDLDLNSRITINGAGRETTVIDGKGLDRVLHVLGGPVALNDLTVTGGEAPDGVDGANMPLAAGAGAVQGVPGQGEKGENGGGIYNEATLQINDCAVRDNAAGNGGQAARGTPGAPGTPHGQSGDDGPPGGSGGYGGGIYNRAGATLSLYDSIVDDNRAGDGGRGGDGGAGGAGAASGDGGNGGRGGTGGTGGQGGGIHNDFTASVRLFGCTLSDNQAGTGARAGDGGQAGHAGEGGQDGNGGFGGDGGKGGRGGALSSDGTAEVSGSRLEGNHAGQGARGGDGGDVLTGALASGASQEATGVEANPHAFAAGTGGAGGMGGSGGAGGGISYNNAQALEFATGVIEGNKAGDGGAGGDGGDGGDGVLGQAGGFGGAGGEGGYGGNGGGVSAWIGLEMKESTIEFNAAGMGGEGGSGGAGGEGGAGTSTNDGGAGGAGDYGGQGGSGGNGGGIALGGALILELSTVSRNTAGDGGQGGIGGAAGQGGAGGVNGGDGGIGGEGGWSGFGGQGGKGGGVVQNQDLDCEVLTTTIAYNSAGNGGPAQAGAAGGVGGPAGGGTPTGDLGDNEDGGHGGRGGSGGYGGGLVFWGKVKMRDSTVNGNKAGDGSAGGPGGAAGVGGAVGTGLGGVGGDGGTGGRGGGIYNANTLYLDNSTISGNEAGFGADGGDGGDGPGGKSGSGSGGDAGTGGGLYNDSLPTSSVNMANVTIAHNKASGPATQHGEGMYVGTNGEAGLGGGVFNTGDIIFKHTLIGDNQAAGISKDCHGPMNSFDYNLVEVNTTECNIFGVVANDIYGSDPALSQLGLNGGPTQTHLPQPASPALDGGNGTCLDTSGVQQGSDQRARPRPVDGDGVGGARCDIGAVEVQGLLAIVAAVDGEGQGTVDTAPPGIHCGFGGSACESYFDQATQVIVAALPLIGQSQVAAGTGSSRFVQWGGDCTGTAMTCTLTMDSAKSVTATFELVPTHTLTVIVEGDGEVSSDPAGIDCGSDCSELYDEDAVVTLTATPGGGSLFAGWSGACSGMASACQVTMDTAKTVTATFEGRKVYLPLVQKAE